MGSMSASDAAPLPRLGEVYFDVRGESRSMRLSWYADTGVAVFSIWQGGTCTGTFRLPIADLPRMVEALRRGPQGHGHAGQAGRPAGAPQRGEGRTSLPPPAGGGSDAGQATAALQVPTGPPGEPGPAGGRHSARRRGDEYGTQHLPGGAPPDGDYSTAQAGGLPAASAHGSENGGPVAGYHTSPHAGYHSGRLGGYRGGRPADHHSGPQPGYHTGPQPGYHTGTQAGYHTEPPEDYHTDPASDYHTDPPAGYRSGSPAGYGSGPHAGFPAQPEPGRGRYPAEEDEPGYQGYPAEGGEQPYAGFQQAAEEPDYPGVPPTRGYPDPGTPGYRAPESPARPYVRATEPVPADPFGERSGQHRRRSPDEPDEPSPESFPYGPPPRARQPHPRERYTARD
jgi:hypothetical protein